MANTNIKLDPEDLTRDELIDILGCNERTFTNRFNSFCRIYNFKRADFNEGSKPRYKKEWKHLLIVLLSPIEDHPFFRKNVKEENIASNGIIYYNTRLLQLIDEHIPLDMRYEIKNHLTYHRTVSEVEALKKVITKLSELLSAVFLVQEKNRMELWMKMYDVFDYWIFDLYEKSFQSIEEQFDEMDENLEQHKQNLVAIEQFPHMSFLHSPKMEEMASLFELNIKNMALEKVYREDRECGSLDGLLAMRLRSLMDYTKEKTKKQSKAFKAKSEAINQITEVIDYRKKQLEHTEQLYGKTADELLKEQLENKRQAVDNHIKSLKNLFDEIATMEDEAKEMMQRTKGYPEYQDTYDRYNGFLVFYSKVRADAKEYEKYVKDMVEKPIINSFKKKK